MKIVVIGNGVAGNTASSVIRHLDNQAEITIISEETYPEYSACALPHYLAGELEKKRLFLRTDNDYSREGIKTLLGQKVISVSPADKRVFLDSRSLPYNKLIVATGSRPMLPPVKGIDLKGVFPLKSLDNADRILGHNSRTAVVVGSGPIGVEAAVALSKRGLQVYLIELLNRIMPRVFDETPSSLLKGMLEEGGIKVFTGEKVTSISGSSKVEGVTTDKRQIECDMVILGAGMKPNVDLAEKSGLKIGSLGGVSTTRQMMTSFNDVYACGDCVEADDFLTGRPSLSLLWHNAKQQGEVAGYNCAGAALSYPGSQNITSLDIFGIHIASFGRLEAETGQQEDIEVIERLGGKKYRRLIMSSGRLIGAQFIGDFRDMGVLLCTLIRGDNLNDIGQMVSKCPHPQLYRLARYIAPTITLHGKRDISPPGKK